MFDDLIGKPYGTGGVGPDFYDCWGLAAEVFRRLGIDIGENNVAEFTCRNAHSLENPHWRRIKNPKSPCLVTIRAHSIYTNHVGVYIGGNKFIHVSPTTFVTIARLNDFAWKKRANGYYEYAG